MQNQSSRFSSLGKATWSCFSCEGELCFVIQAALDMMSRGHMLADIVAIMGIYLKSFALADEGWFIVICRNPRHCFWWSGSLRMNKRTFSYLYHLQNLYLYIHRINVPYQPANFLNCYACAVYLPPSWGVSVIFILKRASVSVFLARMSLKLSF